MENVLWQLIMAKWSKRRLFKEGDTEKEVDGEKRHLLDKHREVPDHHNIKNHKTHPYIQQEVKARSYNFFNLVPSSGFHAHTFTILSKNHGHTLSIPVINNCIQIKGLDMTREKRCLGQFLFPVVHCKVSVAVAERSRTVSQLKYF